MVLEVTERDPIENLTETRRIIAALQGIGVRIAIDDVGTGHSGLSYMLKLGVDIIKIDKMFVDAIGTDRNSTTIVETLVDLAHNMRMDVVAEGVENFEQVMHLRELGIRSAQGYVFAPPLPGSAFLQLVEAIDPLPVQVVEEKGRRRRPPLHVGAQPFRRGLSKSQNLRKRAALRPPKSKRHAGGTSYTGRHPQLRRPACAMSPDSSATGTVIRQQKSIGFATKAAARVPAATFLTREIIPRRVPSRLQRSLSDRSARWQR